MVLARDLEAIEIGGKVLSEPSHWTLYARQGGDLRGTFDLPPDEARVMAPAPVRIDYKEDHDVAVKLACRRAPAIW
jgi:hypothetical protein